MTTYKTRDDVLLALNAQEISIEEAAKALDALKPLRNLGFNMKLSDKRAITIRGKGLSGRFGCTNYAQGWLTLLDHADEIRAFIEANRDALAWKTDTSKE